MSQQISSLIEEAIGYRPLSIRPLSGGCVGDVSLVTFDGHEDLVAKFDPREGDPLRIEAEMLTYLTEKSGLPVPRAVHQSGSILLMEYVDGESSTNAGAQIHAAQLLAELHEIRAEQHGMEFDTLIGGLPQPNRQMSSWREFFATQRLAPMADLALRRGRLDSQLRHRLDRLIAALDRWTPEKVAPSLLHGDVWSGNVLARGDRITAFIDPAIYYGSSEMELAFISLFGTFGDSFFDAYNERRPIEPGFFEERRDLYNLYPLLVHVALFGGSYVASFSSSLRRYGF